MFLCIWFGKVAEYLALENDQPELFASRLWAYPSPGLYKVSSLVESLHCIVFYTVTYIHLYLNETR